MREEKKRFEKGREVKRTLENYRAEQGRIGKRAKKKTEARRKIVERIQQGGRRDKKRRETVTSLQKRN